MSKKSARRKAKSGVPKRETAVPPIRKYRLTITMIVVMVLSLINRVLEAMESDEEQSQAQYM